MVKYAKKAHTHATGKYLKNNDTGDNSLVDSCVLVSKLDFCATIILLGWQIYNFMPFFPVISLFTFPHIFSRPTSFLQKSSCSVSSEKNILNSSVEWSRVEWSDVRKTKSLLSQTCFVYYQYGHTRCA